MSLVQLTPLAPLVGEARPFFGDSFSYGSALTSVEEFLALGMVIYAHHRRGVRYQLACHSESLAQNVQLTVYILLGLLVYTFLFFEMIPIARMNMQTQVLRLELGPACRGAIYPEGPW